MGIIMENMDFMKLPYSDERQSSQLEVEANPQLKVRKSASVLRSFRLRKKEKESRGDSHERKSQLKSNPEDVEQRDTIVAADLLLPDDFNDVSFEFTNDLMSNGTPPTPDKAEGRKKLGRKKSKKGMGKMKKMFKSSEKKNDEEDMDIGLKLALPDKIGIMTGHEVPFSPRSSYSSYAQYSNDSASDRSSTPQKKLMIVPDRSPSVLRRISSISPFRKIQERNSDSTKCSSPEVNRSDVCHPDLSATLRTRTSELEPSVHQTNIPPANEILVHARVCALMETYDQLLEARAKAGKKWFNFGDLVGLSRVDLENLYLSASGKKPEVPLYVGNGVHQPPPLPNRRGSLTLPNFGNSFEPKRSELDSFKSQSSRTITSETSPEHKMTTSKPHPLIIKALLECSDDIVVEGYLAETIGGESDFSEGTSAETSNIQVTVFSSHRQREFMVCFRGSMSQHAKPVKSKATPTADAGGVMKCFSDVYLEANLETKIFRLLNRLMSENPFCDFCFCGHSFAGCLATLAAISCAEKNPMMTISCITFGCPKLAGRSFKERAHSLPNLRIFRIEYGSDYYIDLPNDSSWHHVGHTIAIYNTKEKHSIDGIRVYAQAFKFGKKDTKGSNKSKKARVKPDHEMRSYLCAIENFTHLGYVWVDKFVGEDGDGITGSDNEERFVV